MRLGQWVSSPSLGKLWTILPTSKFWNLLSPWITDSSHEHYHGWVYFSKTLKPFSDSFSRWWFPGPLQKICKAPLPIVWSLMFHRCLQLLPLHDPGWFHVTSDLSLPLLCQLAVRHIIEMSSMDVIHAVHFYLDGTRNSRSFSQKSRMIIKAESPSISSKSFLKSVEKALSTFQWWRWRNINFLFFRAEAASSHKLSPKLI